jgi:hypothetical protein
VLVEVSARRFVIPFECPCCGAAPDAEMAIHLTRSAGRRVATESALALAFPYCQRCVAHVTAWEASGTIVVAVLLGGIIAGVIAGIATHFLVGLGVFAAAIPVAWLMTQARRGRAKASCGPSCACPGRALVYLGWSGSDSAFTFESHTYAARFAEQNPTVLSNASTSLKRLLEGHRVARLAVPTPATAVLTVPPPATLQDWIGRIEACKGAVSRRNILQRALDGLHEKHDRQEVIAAAMRLEVAPVLDEVDGLTSIAAKGRLQRAIDGFRADNIPEELQTAVLRELDTRWRKLG